MERNDCLERIEHKLDGLIEDFNNHRVMVEGRLSKVETRSSIFGALAGALSGALSSFLGLKS